MFESALEGPPFKIEIDDNPDEDGRMVLVVLAENQETTQVCSVKISLSRTIFEENEVWEFAFSIVVFALDESCEAFETQERELAREFIPDGIKGIVMDVVIEALNALLEDIGPDAIYWVTKDIDPHENALKKHHLIREVLERCGYNVAQEGTDKFRRRFWVMVRNGD